MKDNIGNTILLVAFKNTIAEKVVADLPFKNLIIESSHTSIDDLMQVIRNFNYVIGLGEYSGKDQNKLRIETKCNKKFRNQEIKNSERLDIDQILPVTLNSKYSTGIGNSWCNLLSVRVLNSNFRGKYAFIHIPKTIDPVSAKSEIKTLIGEL